ncbi:MAG: response regulator [Nitrospirales bacterium]|nr:response regulator [Nitrospirales bacterium]
MKSSQSNTLNKSQGEIMLSLMNPLLTETPTLPASQPILIVDDDSMYREFLRLLLESYGHCCLEANNGKTALAMIRRSSFGFVITDFQMPYMSGCDLLEQLSRENCPLPPAVVITGTLTDQIQKRALRAGAITILEKPFDQKILLGIIHRYIQNPKSSRRVQLPPSAPLTNPPHNGSSIQHVT